MNMSWCNRIAGRIGSSWLILLSIAAIVCPWWYYLQYVRDTIGPVTKENIGLLGDAFGTINSLFSGVALIGVVVAIILQKQELEETRNELATSAKAHAETVHLLRQEQFERQLAAIRAATPVLVSSNRVESIRAGSGATVYSWTLTNASEPLFSPEISIPDQDTLTFRVAFFSPNVVARDKQMEIRVDLGKVREQDDLMLSFHILLTCIDSSGSKRIQTYMCDPGVNAPIICVDANLPGK